MEKGKLYVVSTPIGNLSDITARAAEVLRSADRIAAEDTRRTIKLLNSLGIKNTLVSFHGHSGKEKLDEIMSLLSDGKSVALVSDAGTPLISDPGEELVAMAAEQGVPVVPIPGACAPVAALSVSGLPSSRFVFEGFLPRAGTARREAIAAIAAETRTIILLESPKRLLRTLEEFGQAFKDRRAVVCRELTKVYEEVVRGTPDEILAHFDGKEVRGEIVIVLEGALPEKTRIPDALIREKLRSCIAAGQTKKEAVLSTAAFFKIHKNSVYKIMLE